ncbi:MAG: hypothetical protein ACP5N2_05060 [Candidatus Nanoarchaeia archaeon]
MTTTNNYLKKIKAKGQIWTLDYIVGLLIFLATVFIAFILIRDLKLDSNNFGHALKESNHISMNLINSGTPSNWNSSNVLIIGISENNRINLTKLDEFDNLTYAKTKLLFQVTGEYVFYFENKTGIINQSKCFRGYDLGESCILQIPPQADNIAKTERLVILNSNIVKMVIVVWNKN